MKSPSPASPRLGAAYRMPAEWEPHLATYLVWPHNRDTWPGKFDAIVPVFARIAASRGLGLRSRSWGARTITDHPSPNVVAYRRRACSLFVSTYRGSLGPVAGRRRHVKCLK